VPGFKASRGGHENREVTTRGGTPLGFQPNGRRFDSRRDQQSTSANPMTSSWVACFPRDSCHMGSSLDTSEPSEPTPGSSPGSAGLASRRSLSMSWPQRRGRATPDSSFTVRSPRRLLPDRALIGSLRVATPGAASEALTNDYSPPAGARALARQGIGSPLPA
jgi:hypothetical protein